jgi:methylenetetrahydrofolate reductase (NADPH)
MHLSELYGAGQFGLSIEIFPPKTPEAEEGLRQTLRELSVYKPAFVSCTYGAGGSTRGKTIDWCSEIQDELGLTATAHFTCVGHSRDELLEWLQQADARGVHNIMALRGDPPAGQTDFVPADGGLSYASDLVTLINEHFPQMGIGVAGYPETHPQAVSRQIDMENLKRKVENGGDAVFTQLFYVNDHFYRYWEEALSLGVNVPIVPGVMPITEFSRIKRIAGMCGAEIPVELASQLEAVQDDKAAQLEIGLEFAVNQCRDLIDHGVPGIHLYVLNKSDAGHRILDALGMAPAETVG